jgi:hypothetical protein
MTRMKGRNEGPEPDPDDTEHGHGTPLGTERKINDPGADEVVAMNRHRDQGH